MNDRGQRTSQQQGGASSRLQVGRQCLAAKGSSRLSLIRCGLPTDVRHAAVEPALGRGPPVAASPVALLVAVVEHRSAFA